MRQKAMVVKWRSWPRHWRTSGRPTTLTSNVMKRWGNVAGSDLRIGQLLHKLADHSRRRHRNPGFTENILRISSGYATLTSWLHKSFVCSYHALCLSQLYRSGPPKHSIRLQRTKSSFMSFQTFRILLVNLCSLRDSSFMLLVHIMPIFTLHISITMAKSLL